MTTPTGAGLSVVALLVVVLLVVVLQSMPAHGAPPDRLTAQAIAFTLRYDRAATDAVPRDRWWAMDKAKHLGGSFLWTLSTQYVLVSKADVSELRALPWSVASGAAIGVAKEAYDWRRGPTRHFSWKDLAADALGVALAAGLIAL